MSASPGAASVTIKGCSLTGAVFTAPLMEDTIGC